MSNIRTSTKSIIWFDINHELKTRTCLSLFDSLREMEREGGRAIICCSGSGGDCGEQKCQCACVRARTHTNTPYLSANRGEGRLEMNSV
jgi:hypothetical protein